MVFFAVRGLGKVKSFAKVMPQDERSPERVVKHLINNASNMVGSVKHLSPEARSMVCRALDIHMQFNLAQMLQGENTPAQLHALRLLIQDAEAQGEAQGEALLKFYLFGLIGVRCGLEGNANIHGSVHMNELNGRSMLLGIECLQQLGQARSHVIYWNYIVGRVSQPPLRFLVREEP